MKRADVVKLPTILGTAIPVRLHLRNDLHLARKSWHMFMGLMIAFIYVSGMDSMTAVMTLSFFLGLDLVLETARLHSPSMNEKILKVMGPLMRTSEVNRVSGVPYYLLATILAVAIFPKPVAVLSILYLACGDPIASLFGVLFGDRSYRFSNGKSLIGTAAGVLTCALVTFVFLRGMPMNEGSVVLLSIIGGLAGGTAELFPLDLDDNFTIPVISGFIVWVAFIAIGI
jgi:dolichol kinase